MASAPYSLPPILSERWQARRWPSRFTDRTLLRLLLCCPYLALAAWADHRGFHSTVNAGLAREARPVDLFSSHLGFLARAYPPVPIFLAAIVPGGAGSLALLDALAAGGLLHLCWERLVRAQVPGWITALLLIGLGAIPVFWFNATENLVGFLGLASFAVAMAATLDFLFAARTSSGFVAGLSLGLAVLCDPAALVYAASVLVAVPFLAWERFRADRHATASTMAVLAYPTLAFLGAWAFLQWRFTGTVWHRLPIAPSAFRFPYGVVDGLPHVLGHLGLQLLCAPVFLLTAGLVLRRRPIAFVAFVVVALDLLVSSWVGLHTRTEQGLVLLNLLGVLGVPSRPTRSVCALYALAVPIGAVLSILLLDGSTIGQFLRATGL